MKTGAHSQCGHSLNVCFWWKQTMLKSMSGIILYSWFFKRIQCFAYGLIALCVDGHLPTHWIILLDSISNIIIIPQCFSRVSWWYMDFFLVYGRWFKRFILIHGSRIRWTVVPKFHTHHFKKIITIIWWKWQQMVRIISDKNKITDCGLPVWQEP